MSAFRSVRCSLGLGVVGEHFFAIDSSYSIFSSQGRSKGSGARTCHTLDRTSLGKYPLLKMNHSEAINEGGEFIAKRFARALIVIERDKVVNLFSWTLIIF